MLIDQTTIGAAKPLTLRANLNSLPHIIVMLTTVFAAQAQDAKAPYASMAPLDQYLIPDRQAEIRLARSAAPAAISDHATVLVLARHGYEEAIKGDNGFTCIVERSWMSPLDSAGVLEP